MRPPQNPAGRPVLPSAARPLPLCSLPLPPVIPSASEESWLDFNLTESNETAAKPRRPPCPSARSETAPSLQPSAPSCHSERSEESWLGFNPAETNETRRKTPVGRLSFRAQRDRSPLLSFRAPARNPG